MAITPRIEVAVGINYASNACAVILIYSAPSYLADPDEVDVQAGDFSDILGPILKPVLASTVTYTGVDVRIIHPQLSYDTSSTSASGAGTVSGDALPAQDAVLIRKRAVGPAKKASGRNWWPGVAESHTTGSSLTPTGLGAWANVANFVKAQHTVNGVPWTPVVMSRSANLLYDIEQARVQEVICTQRRRRPDF